MWPVKLQTFFSHLPFGSSVSWPSTCPSSHCFSASLLCFVFQPLTCCCPQDVPFGRPLFVPCTLSLIKLILSTHWGMIPKVLNLFESRLSVELAASLANPQMSETSHSTIELTVFPHKSSPVSVSGAVSTQTPKQKTGFPVELLFLLCPLELISCKVLEGSFNQYFFEYALVPFSTAPAALKISIIPPLGYCSGRFSSLPTLLVVPSIPSFMPSIFQPNKLIYA